MTAIRRRVLLTALATGLIGAVLELAVMRRVYRAPELFQLLATFGVVLILQDLTLRLWGPAELSLPRPRWMRGFVEIAGSRFPFYDLLLIAAGPVVLGLLWLLLHIWHANVARCRRRALPGHVRVTVGTI